MQNPIAKKVHASASAADLDALSMPFIRWSLDLLGGQDGYQSEAPLACAVSHGVNHEVATVYEHSEAASRGMRRAYLPRPLQAHEVIPSDIAKYLNSDAPPCVYSQLLRRSAPRTDTPNLWPHTKTTQENSLQTAWIAGIPLRRLAFPETGFAASSPFH